MPHRHSLLAVFALMGALSANNLPGSGGLPAGSSLLPPSSGTPVGRKRADYARDFGRLPLSFERNQGQADARVRFLTHSGDSMLFLTSSEAVFAMPGTRAERASDRASLTAGRKLHQSAQKSAQVTVRMQMVGANAKAGPLAQQPLAGRINYFLGSDPHKWQAGVPTFGKVGFHGVYPGIDVVYYGSRQHLEYDCVVAPHADPKQIQLHFAGVQGVHLNAAGDLTVRTAGRELTWRKPTVYQQDAGGRHTVAAHFRLKRLPNGQSDVGFALGRYDADRPLIIDPVLLYSTFLGGSGHDEAYAVTVDSHGNAYIAGFAQSTDFPTTPGVLQSMNRANAMGSGNAFITKLNATGTDLIYSTYLGGSGGNSTVCAARSIAVDGGGQVYVAGIAQATNFPTTPGAFQAGKRTQLPDAGNAFVAKLNSTGTALLYATYLGGSLEEMASGIAIDREGNAYVTGTADSPDFPTTPGAFQPTQHAKVAGSSNAFVAKLDFRGRALLYSTYLGGSSEDSTAGIAVDRSGSVYVTGVTYSADFPTTPDAFQRRNNAPGSHNAFVTKLNSGGTALLYSTYLGGLGGKAGRGDQAYGIAVDTTGDAFVTGAAGSTDFPTTPDAFQRRKPTPNATAFVTKLNPGGTALLYSTYLGGTGLRGDGGRSIAVDTSGSAYIAGYTYSSDFPTTPSAFQRGKAPNAVNAFVARLDPAGGNLLYSTYLGGSNGVGIGDQAYGIAADNSGNAYVVGAASSTDFPTTAGAFHSQKPTHVTHAFATSLSTTPSF